jgi:predicted Zn-dependent peptidase
MASPVAPDFRAQVPALGPERPVIWPQRTRARLANGLEIVLAESHTIPKFTGELFLRSGNAVSSASAPGLASLTSSVARTGTTARTSRQIEEDLRRVGADLSSGASMDTSTIAFSGLADFCEDLLRLVAELASQAAFSAAEFERERRQMLEGVRIERATPGFLAGERIRKVLFGVHPYATVSPTEAQVEAFRREQLVEFYEQNYRPANALLILVGDFQPEAAITQVGRAFGGWQGAKPAAPPDAPLPELRGRRVYLVHLPGAVQAQIVVGNRAITRRHPDWLRCTLANSIYGGAFNSRLVMNIREQKGYTYSPRSSMHALRREGYFTVSAAVRSEVVAATLAEMFYELDRIRALPVGDDELADARNYMSGLFSLGLATQDGLAGQLAAAELDELPEDYLETYRQRIRSLTADDVLAAARQYFDSANMQIVVVGDREQIGHQAALFGPVEVYDQQGNRI